MTAREATAARRRACADLRDSLEAISRTGRLLALESPGLQERFPMPRYTSDRGLVADARATAQHATPLAEAFVAHGLPANVLKELPAQIQAVDQAILAQSVGRETHVGAVAAAQAAIRTGMKAVTALESILMNGPQMHPQTRAIWKNARRIGPARGKEVIPVPAPTPAPAPADKAA